MLTDLAQWLFDPTGMTPHGFCLLWEPGLVWLYAVSDMGIGIAYFAIPVTLAIFAYRRGDLIFHPVFWLFALFILLCGTSHWLDVLTLWVPAYGLEGIIKAATAIVSLITAITVIRLLPAALAIPSQAQLRQANDALRDSEARYRASFDQSPVPLYTLDGQNVITAASQSWLKLMGYPESEVVGKDIEIFGPGGTNPPAQRENNAPARPGDIHDIPRVFRRRDGSQIQVLVSTRIERQDADSVSVICAMIDVTDRLRAEAELRASQQRLHQAQKMEAVGELTGGIAHDFNNMLQSIAGGLHMMERDIARGRSDAALRYLAATRQAISSAAGLTHRLLAFSRRQILQPVPTEANRLIQGMSDLIGRTLGSAIRVELKLNDDPCWTLCDPNQLESGLLDVAINARDAMPQGGVLSIASALRTLEPGDPAAAEGGDYVEIIVVDTGIGMTQDLQARVFEPFFTTKPAGHGTGLGLSQLYGFVHQSGGLVQLFSVEGAGTTLHLLLPRLADPPAASPSDVEHADVRQQPPGEPPTDLAGRSILVVEDQTQVRRQIVDALEELGFTVLQAADGPSGLAILQSDAAIDLMIADVGLPGLNGRQVAESGRAWRPKLPVIFVTGFAGKALDDLPLVEGMSLLRKPFAMDRLITMVAAQF